MGTGSDSPQNGGMTVVQAQLNGSGLLSYITSVGEKIPNRTRVGKLFSVKIQIVNIFNFASHLVSVKIIHSSFVA